MKASFPSLLLKSIAKLTSLEHIYHLIPDFHLDKKR